MLVISCCFVLLILPSDLKEYIARYMRRAQLELLGGTVFMLIWDASKDS
jgi:hypothetical protein